MLYCLQKCAGQGEGKQFGLLPQREMGCSEIGNLVGRELLSLATVQTLLY